MTSSWIRFSGSIPAACSIACGLVSISWLIAPVKADGQVQALQVRVDPADGSYTVGVSGADQPVLHAGVAAKINGSWLQSKRLSETRV